MSRYVIARTSFDSTHYDTSESVHPHGHRFRVEVTEQTEVTTRIRESLSAVCSELHLHELHDMLTGGSQSGQGIASWILERLLINHPKITRIEVSWDPDITYGITRDIR